MNNQYKPDSHVTKHNQKQKDISFERSVDLSTDLIISVMREAVIECAHNWLTSDPHNSDYCRGDVLVSVLYKKFQGVFPALR